MATAALASGPDPSEQPRLLNLSTILADWEADAIAAHRAHLGNQPRGPHIPFPHLASILGGAWPGGLHVLHGQPGTGKTALGLQLAAEAGCPALYLTAEMAPLELVRRVVARISGQYLGRFKTGEFTPEQSLAYARAALTKVPTLAFADATRAWASPEWLRDHAEAVRGDNPFLLIVVDSLHSWAEGADFPRMTEYDILNAAIASLRQLAGMLSCSVVAIAERNRISMSGGGLSAGAGTRKIEYGAETVIDLQCEQDVQFDARGEKPVSLKVVKNRNGDRGACELSFHGALQRFR
jgi:replicative DNA helicase